MDRQTTLMDAWEDFYKWIRNQPEWSTMTDGERKRIYDAQADFKGTRGKQLGATRIKSILGKHAPERYTFEHVVIIHE